MYLQPWPVSGRRWRISQGGGGNIRWNPRGGELFYGTGIGEFMSVTISGTSAAPTISTPRRILAAVSGGGSGSSLVNVSPYDVSGDGQRFLVAVPVNATTTATRTPLTVTLNWHEIVRQAEERTRAAR